MPAPPKARKADPEILLHDQKRKVEAKLYELRDILEDEGVSEEEIAAKVEETRAQLMLDLQTQEDKKQLKPHQIHEMAVEKEKELERLQKAFDVDSEGKSLRRQERKRFDEAEFDGVPKGPRQRPRWDGRRREHENGDDTRGILDDRRRIDLDDRREFRRQASGPTRRRRSQSPIRDGRRIRRRSSSSEGSYSSRSRSRSKTP
ncbi:Pre-mRNA-splicing factor CWC21 [Neolecta irregularis DAH-3]|uniref:Pre-mRNA-splicing factor CWC21 n=1 Tax=Neolecta irregularis (strain DAH-3) TaxID=1198029 RepID=A0A1U7LVG0_NEOID|nr:Pre-mRNA-splicing factor CWC21 [Neolecta irregularis DAH-3]|eukprot:OLL26608.1 Pre-mRNA-splicing factor CWC21 [Neolecta irregularis DAH-3]